MYNVQKIKNQFRKESTIQKIFLTFKEIKKIQILSVDKERTWLREKISKKRGRKRNNKTKNEYEKVN